MAVDEQFTPQVKGSPFTRQEWGMIMTAVEFDIEQPGDEEAATLVADTSDIPAILPELQSLRDHQASMAPGGGGPGGGSGGGLLDTVRDALGLGGDGSDEPDPETLDAAERLVDAYVVELQSYLEGNGQWAEVRAAYGEG
jgi:hypothetical protein